MQFCLNLEIKVFIRYCDIMCQRILNVCLSKDLDDPVPVPFLYSIGINCFSFEVLKGFSLNLLQTTTEKILDEVSNCLI